MICVDASVAAKWLFSEDLSDRAEALYEETIQNGERIVAPALLAIEITNLIRQRMGRIRPPEEVLLTLTQARQHLDQFMTFPITLSVLPPVHARALELAALHNLPAVYDAHYLALADLLDIPYWTADNNLVKSLREALPFVHWIGDY